MFDYQRLVAHLRYFQDWYLDSQMSSGWIPILWDPSHPVDQGARKCEGRRRSRRENQEDGISRLSRFPGLSFKRNYANKLLAALQCSVDITFINLNNADGYDFLDRNGWLMLIDWLFGSSLFGKQAARVPLFFAMKCSWAKMGFQTTTATWVERIFGITCSPVQCRQISGMSPEVNSSMGGFFC